MSVDFHFLNVGYGDCTIVHWPERTAGEITKDERIMMVDIYHHEDHEDYEDAIEYYRRNFKKADGSIKPIFRFVCSHPHQDHICGLKKIFDDNGIKILNFWDLDHSFEPSDFEGHPTHEDDWEAYKKLGGNDSPATVIKTQREKKAQKYWDSEGDRITILSPSDKLIKHAHEKNDGSKRDPDAVEIDEMSYALSIQVNKRYVILAGDGRSSPTWEDIYDNCQDTLKTCSVLKAGHHGHECSFHEDSLKLMDPEIIIFSNSESEDEDHGAESEYDRVCPNADIYKTYLDGNIVVRVPFEETEEIKVDTNCI